MQLKAQKQKERERIRKLKENNIASLAIDTDESPNRLNLPELSFYTSQHDPNYKFNLSQVDSQLKSITEDAMSPAKRQIFPCKQHQHNLDLDLIYNSSKFPLKDEQSMLIDLNKQSLVKYDTTSK